MDVTVQLRQIMRDTTEKQLFEETAREYQALRSIALREGEEIRTNSDDTITLITASGGEHTFVPAEVFGEEE